MRLGRTIPLQPVIRWMMLSPPIDISCELFACLQAMGARQTNPVLEILDCDMPIREWEKYPSDYLRFGGGFRAYYHCHAAPEKPQDEHGHFHVFRRIPGADGKNAWTHVAGLSMDRMGQPLRWFAVNLWVTGGVWLDAPILMPFLERLSQETGDPLSGRWLAAMLRLYRREIELMLKRRDQNLTRIKASHAENDIFQERSVYGLAEQPIDLLEILRRS